MKTKKYKLSKSLIPIINGAWGTPEELERLGISKEDVIKLRAIMEGIVKEKRLLESPELDYFLALAGHFETQYSYDNGKLKKNIIHIPVDNPSCTSPYWKALPPTGLFYEYSFTLQDLARNLIEILYEHDFIERLRKCGYCNNFFVAKDMKRKICYSKECFREYKRIQKKRQRDEDPVKYI